MTDMEHESSPALPGQDEVDEALAKLDSLDDLEVSEHPAVFDHIHTVLRESLSDGAHDEDLPVQP